MRRGIAEAQRVFGELVAHEATVAALTEATVKALRSGNKILACGNGGSCAEAQHLVTELVGRYKSNRAPLPAVFLGGDPSMITCIANDFSWDEIFSRPLRGLAKPGDLVFCFSSSGQSPNVVKTLQTARELGLSSVAFLGKGGGASKGLATFEIVVGSQETARVQESHLFLLHTLCEQIDAAFLR